MAQTTYQVVLSADRNHQVIVTTDTQGGTKLALARAKVNDEAILERFAATAMQAEEEDQTPEEPIPEREVHHVPMAWQKGKEGYFWSCRQRNDDDNWCSLVLLMRRRSIAGEHTFRTEHCVARRSVRLAEAPLHFPRCKWPLKTGRTGV